MILYEVSGSQITPEFYRSVRKARARFNAMKSNGNDAELDCVRVTICADRQIELLNGDWGNARELVSEIDIFDPQQEAR